MKFIARPPFFPLVKLDYPVTLGGYRNQRSPDEPMILHLLHTIQLVRASSRSESCRSQSYRGIRNSFRKFTHRPRLCEKSLVFVRTGPGVGEASSAAAL